MISRCELCHRLKLFGINHIGGRKLCDLCLKKIHEDEKRRLEEEIRKKRRSEEIDRGRQRNIKANMEFLKKLEQEKLKLQRKTDKEKQRCERRQKPDISSIHHEVQNSHGKQEKPPHNILPTREELDLYPRLLIIQAGTKRLTATHFIDGKKRVLINREREIRRTHKGGFSQEKFQRFVDQQKKKTFPWITGLLEKDSLLKPPYDKIKIFSRDQQLAEMLKEYAAKYLR